MVPQEPFKRNLFVLNIVRLRRVLSVLGNVNAFLESCFTWQSAKKSVTAFVVFEVSLNNQCLKIYVFVNRVGVPRMLVG